MEIADGQPSCRLPNTGYSLLYPDFAASGIVPGAADS
jgi:hypothetical protein